MKVKIKKLIDIATIPKYAKPGDAGLDLVATSYKNENGCFVYGTGLAIEIPLDYVGLIFPRSSVSNTCLYLTNAVGVIDSGYRGELILKFGSDSDYYIEKGIPKYQDNYVNVKSGTELPIYKIGEKIGQLLIILYPQIEFEEVDELSETSRSEGGFGSTGN